MHDAPKSLFQICDSCNINYVAYSESQSYIYRDQEMAWYNDWIFKDMILRTSGISLYLSLSNNFHHWWPIHMFLYLFMYFNSNIFCWYIFAYNWTKIYINNKKFLVLLRIFSGAKMKQFTTPVLRESRRIWSICILYSWYHAVFGKLTKFWYFWNCST